VNFNKIVIDSNYLYNGMMLFDLSNAFLNNSAVTNNHIVNGVFGTAFRMEGSASNVAINGNVFPNPASVIFAPVSFSGFLINNNQGYTGNQYP
jgi:hypothetical protein